MRKKNKSVFSEAEEELAQVELEVNQQTDDIDAFLKRHEHDHVSCPAFRMLKDLYNMFNAQMAENLELRKRMSQTNGHHKTLCESKRKTAHVIQSFIHRMEAESGRTFPDFATLVDFLESELKRMEISTKCEQELLIVNSQRTLLQRQLQFAKEKNETIQQKIHDTTAENSMILAELNARTENVSANVMQLRRQIDEQEQKRIELQTEISTLKSAALPYKKKIEEQETAVKKKVDEFRQMNRQRNAKLEALEMDLAQITAHHTQTSTERNGVSTAFERAKSELALIEKKVDEEMSELIKEMQTTEQEFVSGTRHLDEVMDWKTELLAQLKSWSQKEIEQKKRSADLRTEIAEMRAKLTSLETLESEMSQEIEENRETISRFRCGENNLEDFMENVRHINEELTVQVKRLQSQIRVAKGDAERVSAENERLLSMLSRK